MASHPAPSFAETFQPYVDRIDRALDQYTQLPEGSPPRLTEAIRHSLLGSGKRLRPLLVLLSAETCGSPWEAAIPAACAVEMVHTYSLIHDDLPSMDNDDFRRGRPSCHVAFGEATAILAGDGLLALAFEVLGSELTPAVTAARCCAVLATAAGPTEMVGGQWDDLSSEPESGTPELLESIHRRKTGAMISASLELGGIVAEADSRSIEKLRLFGSDIGLAFQIVDDLLDHEGSQSLLGKRTRKDKDANKLTFPGLIGVEESRRRAEQLVTDACDVAATFGSQGANLVRLAHYIIQRDR